MRHLFHSTAEVIRLSSALDNGTPIITWTKVAAVVDPLHGIPGEFRCRLDLTFIRPGKDQPMAAVAGRAPDRVGVLFFDPTPHVLAGDRIRLVAGPVSGTFEIRTIPDPAIDLALVHHMEVQVIEVAQQVTGVFPAPGVEGS